LLLAVIVIGFLYFRTLASVEELGELAPTPAAEVGLKPRTELEHAKQPPTTAPASERLALETSAQPPAAAAESEPEAPPPAATIMGMVRDPHGKPARALLRYVWNDRGRMRDVHGWSSREGRFVLELPQAETVGDLLASVYKHSWSPTAKIAVAAGSSDLELTLGPPAFFEVEFRALDGAALAAPWTSYYWELAGNRIQDYPGPSGADSLRWAASPVPFWISARPQGARHGWFGPFDPRDVGAKLILEVERLPVARGRVMHAGTGVEGAKVEFEPLEDSSRSARGVSNSPRGASTGTDADGRFELSLMSPGRFGPVAFHGKYGSGRAPAMVFDGEHDLDGIEIELDSPPGSLHVSVVLPLGRSATDIWLTVEGVSGFRTPRTDGSFLLPDLEPGICRISITDGSDEFSGVDQFGRAFEFGGPDQWVHMSHGPGPPDWVPQEFQFKAEVVPGVTREIELDLSGQPPCRLQGSLSIGAPFHGVRDPRDYFSSDPTPTPRLSLDHGDFYEADAAAVTLDPEGRFLVGVTAPGLRRLATQLGFPGIELQWEITDEVELLPGTREWNLTLTQGSLRLLPPDREHPIWQGPVLDWRGSGNQAIRILYALTDEAEGSVLYRHVPAGTVTFTLERAGAKRDYSCEIRAGETSELRLPE
jgi:hypothetical protein